MKKIIKLVFTIIAMFIVLSTYAQDKIVLKTGTNIESKVLEINLNTVKYKKFNNSEGPTFVLDKNEIHMIIYENGVNEIFDNSSPQRSDENDSSAKKYETKFGKNRFEVSFGAAGYGTEDVSYSGLVNAISYERILNNSGLLSLKFRGESEFTEYDEIILTFGVSFNVYPFKNARWLYVGPTAKVGTIIIDEYDYSDSASYLGLGLGLGNQFQITRLFGIRAGFELYLIQVDSSTLGDVAEFQAQLGFNFSF